MPPSSRVGDIGLGHSSFPPTPATAGSPNVMINSIPAHRLGDAIAPHGSPSPSPVHGRAAAAGSSSVFTNSKAQVRIGDAISCGGVLGAGSGNVITGG